VETAFWLDADFDLPPDDADRIYWGHESDAQALLSMADAHGLARRLSGLDIPLTLVTPCLIQEELGRICALVESLIGLLGRMEVVCNDWGLFRWLTLRQRAEPIIGRLLAGQATDPRLAAFDMPERQIPHERTVRHADGTQVELRYRRPPRALMTHLQRCAVDIPAVLAYLGSFGARRLEVSNLLQGIRLELADGWRASLHLPEVPVAVARNSLGEGEAGWHHPTFPVALRRRGNTVFYRNDQEIPEARSSRIDRVVYRKASRDRLQNSWGSL